MEFLNYSTIILLLSFFVCNSITKNHDVKSRHSKMEKVSSNVISKEENKDKRMKNDQKQYNDDYNYDYETTTNYVNLDYQTEQYYYEYDYTYKIMPDVKKHFDCPVMKKGFALFENRCYYFARNIWDDPSNIYDNQANTYSDTKRICKTVFGPNVVGKMIEPKSSRITELIKEYVTKNFFQHPDAPFPIPHTMWIGIQLEDNPYYDNCHNWVGPPKIPNSCEFRLKMHPDDPLWDNMIYDSDGSNITYKHPSTTHVWMNRKFCFYMAMGRHLKDIFLHRNLQCDLNHVLDLHITSCEVDYLIK